MTFTWKGRWRKLMGGLVKRANGRYGGAGMVNERMSERI